MKLIGRVLLALVLLGGIAEAQINLAGPGIRCIPTPTQPPSFGNTGAVGLWCPTTGPNANTLLVHQNGTDTPFSSGSGTVTSVNMTVPTWLTVTGAPVTTSGTLAVTAAGAQAQNQVLATPNGTTGAVALRTLVNADLPGSGALTVTAGTGLSGGGSVALGASTTLSLPNTGPGAGAQCGGANYVNSATLDAQGRITAITCGTPGGSSTGNWTFTGNNADLTGAGAMGIGNIGPTATSVVFGPTTVNFKANTTLGNTAQAATNTTALTVAPNVADGASSVALLLNNTTTLANATAKLVSLQNNGTEYYSFAGASSTIASNSHDFVIQRDSNNKITIFSGGIQLLPGGSGQGMQVNGNDAYPLTDNFPTLGDSTHRWKGDFAYWHDCNKGAQLTAAASITPTACLHHVTGATTITTIATTNVQGNSIIVLVADGGTITLNTGGNIGANTTIAQNTMRVLWFDGTTWYPEN